MAAGTGYGAAVLAACGAQVTALEEDQALIALARAALAAIAPSRDARVRPAGGRLAAGAPYDIILIEGAVRDIPAALGPQLRPGRGRLVTVRTGHGSTGKGVLAEPTAGGLARAADLRLRHSAHSRPAAGTRASFSERAFHAARAMRWHLSEPVANLARHASGGHGPAGPGYGRRHANWVARMCVKV